MPQGAKSWADGREDPAAGHQLIVYFRRRGSQSESENTTSRRGGEEFTKFPLHVLSDYPRRFVVAYAFNKLP
jgi:hypothetical protein